MSLYHKNDWVGQYTLTWCVGASIQMMVNIALPGQDRTRATQADHMLLAQGGEELNEDRGAGSWGWADASSTLALPAPSRERFGDVEVRPATPGSVYLQRVHQPPRE